MEIKFDVFPLNPKPVVVVTPTNERPKIIVEAAKSNKHVFVDKGVGNSMDEIMRMAEVVKRSRVKFSCNLTVQANIQER